MMEILTDSSFFVILPGAAVNLLYIILYTKHIRQWDFSIEIPTDA